MKPQVLALITAAAWGIGGFFEKKGLHAGGLTPQVGITIRTAVALIILGAVSYPNWKSISQAGTKSLLLMIIGGGVIAGSVGMLSFYAALRGASSLTQVMAVIFGGEKLNVQTVIGSVLTLAGIVILTSGGA